jgi:hypothetical protein
MNKYFILFLIVIFVIVLVCNIDLFGNNAEHFDEPETSITMTCTKDDNGKFNGVNIIHKKDNNVVENSMTGEWFLKHSVITEDGYVVVFTDKYIYVIFSRGGNNCILLHFFKISCVNNTTINLTKYFTRGSEEKPIIQSSDRPLPIKISNKDNVKTFEIDNYIKDVIFTIDENCNITNAAYLQTRVTATCTKDKMGNINGVRVITSNQKQTVDIDLTEGAFYNQTFALGSTRELGMVVFSGDSIFIITQIGENNCIVNKFFKIRCIDIGTIIPIKIISFDIDPKTSMTYNQTSLEIYIEQSQQYLKTFTFITGQIKGSPEIKVSIDKKCNIVSASLISPIKNPEQKILDNNIISASLISPTKYLEQKIWDNLKTEKISNLKNMGAKLIGMHNTLVDGVGKQKGLLFYGDINAIDKKLGDYSYMLIPQQPHEKGLTIPCNDWFFKGVPNQTGNPNDHCYFTPL